MEIIRDASMDADRNVFILDVVYPDKAEWDTAAFEALKAEELETIRAEGADYDRESRFRNDPYFRYFRKFKKTYPVMMQIESFLLKGKPFPEATYINSVAFLTELKTGILLGTHDVDRVLGNIVLYQESEKTPFTGMFGSESHSYPGDTTGRDDGGVIISMIAGADDRTCIHDDTRHVIYLVFGYPGMEKERFDLAIENIERFVKTLAPTAEMSGKMY